PRATGSRPSCARPSRTSRPAPTGRTRRWWSRGATVTRTSPRRSGTGSARASIHVAPELILEGEGAMQKSMAKLLGLDRASDVAKLEDAVDKMKNGTKAEREEAEKVLGGMGLESYVNKLDAIFQAVDLALGLKELMENPDARKAIESAKSTAD